MNTRRTCLVLSGLILMSVVDRGLSAPEPATTATIFRDAEIAPIVFAAGEIRQSLTANGYDAKEKPFSQFAGDNAAARIIVTLDTEAARQWLERADVQPIGSLAPQGYAIRRTDRAGIVTVRIVGADPAGAMYGGLDAAESIRLNNGISGIADAESKPDIKMRGVKFNFPLDARTPSYDDTGDAAQNNIAAMWDFDFWRSYLDAMARNRYNVLTLWNPHPFPSLVKLPNYPECALNDVCATTLKPEFEHGKWADPQGVTPEILTNLKVIKPLAIDAKIDFWRRVMRHAKDRCIDVYLVTWNVLVNSAAGKYGITDAQDNPKTIAYLRECVRETILAYPDLAGLGITAGENMRQRSDQYAKEKWLWSVYGEGIIEAKQKLPGRKINFIHRHWQTSVEDLLKEWAAYPDSFSLSFKYARARLYSSPKPPFADSLVNELKEHQLKCWWNLRNDDIFVFRWGNPEYVRSFLRNLPPAEITAGYYVGSDGYVWGREFISTEPESPRQLEVDKHWLNFMLWGRLGYDLDLDRDYFEKRIVHRFPEAAGVPLYDAWARASEIIPLVNRFHWRDWDFMWSVEGCIDQRKGFHTVRDFIQNPTMETSGLMSIPDYVERKLAGQPMTGATPAQTAQTLQAHAQSALRLVAQIRRQISEPSKELRLTLGDIESMCHLGNYYAAKILGATELHLFDKSNAAPHKETAIGYLQQAASHWEQYATTAAAQYRPQLLARTRELDWLKLLEHARHDVEIAKTE